MPRLGTSRNNGAKVESNSRSNSNAQGLETSLHSPKQVTSQEHRAPNAESGDLDTSEEDATSQYKEQMHDSTQRQSEKTIAEPRSETHDTEAAVSTQHGVSSVEYSVFTTWEKRFIILAASWVSWFSPMASTIYYPALTQIGIDLHKSPSAINITVTTYLIFQGLAPMITAGFSDKAGRRPAYIICFVLFIAANLGLALQDSYVALLILRMLQSSGSSGTIALSSGIAGDIVTSAQRGQYIAWASIGTILGPSLSPIIGGLLAQNLGWHWIFWFLVILSCATFVPFVLFFPETCRNLVGDASVPPPWTSKNISDTYRHKKRAAKGIQVDEEKQARLRANYKFTAPNPLTTLVLLGDIEAALLLLSMGIAVANFHAISTGASEVFSQAYGFSEIQIGLCFLSFGGGSLISVFTTGRFLDWNYRRHAKRLNFPYHKTRETDISDFPIERVRMEMVIPFIVLGTAALIGYGWVLEARTSPAGPIVLLFLLGYCLFVIAQSMQVVMVDIYPTKPATAGAANNVVRCLLGAALTAAIGPMVDAMGYGWAYTLLALLLLASATGPLLSIKYGIKWRKAMKERDERRRQKKEAENKG